jgi:hypothetical protein
MKDQLSAEQLKWLVDSRAHIQEQCRRLYRLAKDNQAILNNSSLGDVANLCIGAAFSLWRGVFLAPKDFDWGGNFEEGLRYLYNVIRTNNVSFGTDDNHSKWVSGYYLNNAVFRVWEVGKIAPNMASKTGENLREIWLPGHEPQKGWDDCCTCLGEIIDALEREIDSRQPERGIDR